MAQKYNYEIQLLKLAHEILSITSGWKEPEQFSFDTELSNKEIEILFDGVARRLSLGYVYYGGNYNHYRAIIRRSFYNTTEITTVKKFVHVFEPMFKKYLSEIYPKDGKTKTVSDKPKAQSEILQNKSQQELIKIIQKHRMEIERIRREIVR